MSGKRNAHIEALQIAMDTEKVGYKFYMQAAASTKDVNGRKVFEHLAKDEIEHMGVIATIYESLEKEEPWITYEEALFRYGQTEQSREVFPEGPGEAEEGFDDLRALEEALGFEKKAVEFYQKMMGESDDDKAGEFYKRLVEIEEGHVKIIQAEIDSLTGTGIWLDYQEISLEH